MPDPRATPVSLPLILVADDSAPQRFLLRKVLHDKLGYQVAEAADGRQAVEKIRSDKGRQIQAVFLDLDMPEMDGRQALVDILAIRPDLPVIILTASESVRDVVDVIKAGAADFLLKPADPDLLKNVLKKILRVRQLEDELKALHRAHEGRQIFSDIVGREGLSAAIRLATRAATTDVTVLITGESGTGKEIFARAIHHESHRQKGPFVAINCGAIPKNLVESILFGHQKGAFTGAVADSPGKFREAEGGTLFLDEIGELPMDSQVKLLRAIQSKDIQPVGSSRSYIVNTRIMAATNRNPRQEVAEGHLREDLFYRLNVFPVHLPPLRKRPGDILPLARYFLEKYARLEGRVAPVLSMDVQAWLQAHTWPGNVRELENMMYRAVILGDDRPLDRMEDRGQRQIGQAQQDQAKHDQAKKDQLQLDQLLGLDDGMNSSPTPLAGVEPLGPVFHRALRPSQPARVEDETLKLIDASGREKTLKDIQYEAMAAALARYHGHVARAAQALSIGRSTLYKLLQTGVTPATPASNQPTSHQLQSK